MLNSIDKISFVSTALIKYPRYPTKFNNQRSKTTCRKFPAFRTRKKQNSSGLFGFNWPGVESCRRQPENLHVLNASVHRAVRQRSIKLSNRILTRNIRIPEDFDKWFRVPRRFSGMKPQNGIAVAYTNVRGIRNGRNASGTTFHGSLASSLDYHASRGRGW